MFKLKNHKVRKIVTSAVAVAIITQTSPISALSLGDEVVASTDRNFEDQTQDNLEQPNEDTTDSDVKENESNIPPSMGENVSDDNLGENQVLETKSLENISIDVDPELGKDFVFGEAINTNISFSAIAGTRATIPQNTVIRLNISSSAIDYSNIQISPQNHAIELIKSPDQNYIEIKFNQDFTFDANLTLSVLSSIKSNQGVYTISSELIDKDGNISNLPLKDGASDEIFTVISPSIGVSGWLDPFWDGENYIGKGTLNDGSTGGIFNPKTNEIRFKSTLTAKKDVDNIGVTITLDSNQVLDINSLQVIDKTTNDDITNTLSITTLDNIIKIDTGTMLENTQYLIKFATSVDSFDRIYTTNFESVASNGEIGGYPIKSGFKMNTGGAVPKISAHNLITYVNEPLNLLENVAASDIEDGDLTKKIVVNDSLVDWSNPGTYKATYIVQDSDYNSSMKTVDVVVLSNDAPIINGTNNVTIKVSEVDSFNKLSGVTAEDKEDGPITSKIIVSGKIEKPNPGNTGTYQLIYSVTDSKGNTTTVTREITVTNQVPIISGLNEITIKKGQVYDLVNGVSAHDYEDGDVSASIVYPNITKQQSLLIRVANLFNKEKGTEALDVGVHNLEYSVTDSDGNTTTESRTINVSSNKAPTINGTDDIEIPLGKVDSFDPLAGITVTDDHDTLTSADISVSGSIKKPSAGNNVISTLTYTVTDSDGNATTETRKITVTNQAPKILGLSEISVRKGQTFDLANNVIANDYEDGDITINLVLPTDDISKLEVGSHQVEYSITDSDGNTTIKKRTLNISSNNAPTINGTDDIEIPLGKVDSFNPLAGITVTDDHDTLTSADISVSGSIKKPSTGNNVISTLTYTVTDSDGNVTTETRKITVTNQAPKILGLSEISIRKGQTFDLANNVIANDYEDGDITINLVLPTDDISKLEAGSHKVEYSSTDSDGNITTEYRTIIVKNPSVSFDAIPEIKGTDDATILEGSNFDPKDGVTAYDKEDGNLTDKITIEGKVDTAIPGSYKLIYKVTDSTGNTCIKTRTVQVIKNIESLNNTPILELKLGELIIKKGEKFNPLDFVSKAYDKEDGDLLDKVTYLFKSDNNNEISEVLYSVSDSHGATTTKILKVTIDRNAPNTNNPTNNPYTENPQTGDVGVIGYMSLIVASGIGLLINRKRRK